MAAGLLLLTAVAGAGQEPAAGVTAPETRELTLARAEALALEGNRTLAASLARAEAADARARGAGAFRWPTVGVEAGYVRSDDPVAAFGTKLRQARFAEADFALDALNRPDAVDDWTGMAGVQWKALDATAWAGRDAARAGARAASLESDRTREAILFRTRILYLEALRVQARLDAARASEDAAASTLEVMEQRREQGLLTDADVLQARAAMEDRRARRVDAERAVADARARLAVHLGLPAGAEVIPADTLPDPTAPAPAVAPDVEGRADLEASRAGLEAMEARVRAARLARLPSLEAFGQLSSHAPDPFEGREGNYTVGLQLRVPVFTGGRIGAAVEEARAMERAALLEHRDRVEAARLELREARRAVDAARQGAEAAAAAAAAAEEAFRLMQSRFREGMATTAELLQAEARASSLRTGAVDARARVQQALAALDFARGTAEARPDPTADPADTGATDDHR